MLPSRTPNYFLNRVPCDAKDNSNVTVRNSPFGGQPTNLPDLIGCELSRPNLLTPNLLVGVKPGRVSVATGRTTLGNHVKAVIPRGTEKQMVGANTPRIVAVMTDKHAIGNRAVGCFPGKTVRVDCALPTYAETTIATGTSASTGPLPAAIAFSDKRPKARGGRSRPIRGATGNATELAKTTRDIALIRPEWLTALQAFALDHDSPPVKYSIAPSTYRYNNQNRLRVVAFGGLDADWGSSLLEVQAYLKANQAAWEPAEA